jgi:hypothetical protein
MAVKLLVVSLNPAEGTFVYVLNSDSTVPQSGPLSCNSKINSSLRAPEKISTGKTKIFQV